MPEMPDLTDDDLAAHLSRALHESTRDLAYRGAVPTPRSAAWTAVPSAAVVAAAVGAIAVVPALNGPDPTRSAGGTSPAATSSATPTATASASDDAHYSLAAFRGFDRQLGPMPLLHGDRVPDGQWFEATMDADPPPADARPIELDGPGEAYVGTDPANGQETLWVRVPTRNGNRMFSLTSPTATEQGLLDLLLAPRPVPATH